MTIENTKPAEAVKTDTTGIAKPSQELKEVVMQVIVEQQGMLSMQQSLAAIQAQQIQQMATLQAAVLALSQAGTTSK